MRSVLGIDDVLPVLRNVVKDYGPDYIYTAPDGALCVYCENGCPSCLIGHVLHRLGEDISCIGNDHIRSVFDRGQLTVRLTRLAVQVLQAAQYVQDGTSAPMGTWGKALEAAEQKSEQIKSMAG